MIRAVLFDADGVIQSSPQFPRLIAAMVSEHEREAFAQAIFDAEQPCLTGDADFGERMMPVLREWKLEGAYRALLQVFHEIQPDEDVLRHVDAVRATGITCCIASNQQLVRATHMSRALGYAKRFDREFYSHTLGVAKPNIAYFHRIVGDLALPAQQVLFIDDSQPNVGAASAAGLISEYFPSNSGGQHMGALLQRHGLLPD